MKKLLKNKILFTLACFSCFTTSVVGQEVSKPELMTTLHYLVNNNRFQYLQVHSQIKAENKLQPAKNVVFQLYLDSISTENVIAKIKTDEKGVAKSLIPVALKDKWSSSTTHKFIAVSNALTEIESTTTELEIAKAKIVMDTVNEEGQRKVVAEVLRYENGEWLPTKDVELKIGIRRLGSIIKVGEDESYTTDSVGQASAEYKLSEMPGDKKGNIILVARVEDNENYGTLSVEQIVPWGVYVSKENNFGKRSLFASRGKAPVWLLSMAYIIMALVWGVLVYLIFQLFQIKKAGRNL